MEKIIINQVTDNKEFIKNNKLPMCIMDKVLEMVGL